MPEPQLQPIGDELWLTWPSLQVAIGFTYVREAASGCSAEVVLSHVPSGQTFRGHCNLGSAQSRAGILRAATGLLNGDTPWPRLLHQGCQVALDHLRRGEPAEVVHPQAPAATRWFLPQLVPLGQTAVFFGDGGAGKSLLLLALALAALGGGQVGRWRPAPVHRALYLDWEVERSEVDARSWGLAELAERLPADRPLLYRGMRRALVDDLPAVRREVAQHHVDLVLCDSLGPACGAEPESADAAVRTLNALRTLTGTTRLVAAHMSKTAADQTKGAARPFGSVYVQNLARSVIEVRRDDLQEPQQLGLTCYHRKANSGSLQPAAGFRFYFDDLGYITVRTADADLTRSPLLTQIRTALLPGHSTVKNLSRLLDYPPPTIKKVLQRLENRDIVTRITGTHGGQGKETLWGLKLQPGHDYRDN
jgi:hypothetical protein